MSKAHIQIMHSTVTKQLEKSIDQYTPIEHQRVHKNYNALNAFYCALNAKDFNIIHACEIVSEVWGSW